MGFTISKNQQSPIQPEGKTRSRITEVEYLKECKTKHGIKDRICIHHLTEEGYVIKQGYNASLYEGSHLGKLIIGLLGTLPDEFDTDTLLGMECEIEVIHFTDDKGIIHDNIASAKRVCEEEKELNQNEMEALFNVL